MESIVWFPTLFSYGESRLSSDLVVALSDWQDAFYSDSDHLFERSDEQIAVADSARDRIGRLAKLLALELGEDFPVAVENLDSQSEDFLFFRSFEPPRNYEAFKVFSSLREARTRNWDGVELPSSKLVLPRHTRKDWGFSLGRNGHFGGKPLA